MVPDADLPVFSFRANWRDPMVERLSFLTDVLGAAEGAEQRRSLRPTPRRTFDADFLLTGNERTFWDLFVNRLGRSDMMVPIYWEVATIPAALVALSSDRINFDTTLTEWTYHEGGLAILQGKTAMDYEVVEIAAVDGGGVDLASPVLRPWPRGTKLLPLRRGIMEDMGSFSSKSAGVATITARFRFKAPNPWDPAADESDMYLGDPVFNSEPNWVEDLNVEFAGEMLSLDASVGLTYEVDASNRVRLGQAHRWFLPGREKLASFRDLIYRHRGRAGAFWLPTFKADLRLATAAGSAATQIVVENVGYSYTGGPTSGREHIAIKHSGGTIYRRVTSVVPGTTPATEKLNLAPALGLDLAPGQVRRISFLDAARFDADDFDIQHYGGPDAHHDVTSTFRTFKNTRDPSGVILDPIPAAEMSNELCGDWDPGPCYTPPQTFDGWDYEIWMRAEYDKHHDFFGPALYAHVHGGSGGGGVGGAIGDLSMFPPNTALASSHYRRMNMAVIDPGRTENYADDWGAFVDVGIVNFFGTPPEDVNTATYTFYCRHWTDPFPGTQIETIVSGGNGDLYVLMPMTKDWRDYR